MKFRSLISGDLVTEASFNPTNMAKVSTLLSKIMGRKMGGAFRQIGIESYNRKTGRGKGIRVMNDSGEMLRFNWDEKLAKTATAELTSIDFWDRKNKNFQRPTRTVMLGNQANIIQVVDIVTKALMTGMITESTAILDEARSKDEKQEWLISRGLPKSASGSEKIMRQVAAKKGFSEELEVFLGQTETNTFESDLKVVEKQFSKEVFANPDTVFEDIEDLLSVVARKEWRTLVVCGMGGVGKCVQGETRVNVEGI